jgi:hypothetical protein
MSTMFVIIISFSVILDDRAALLDSKNAWVVMFGASRDVLCGRKKNWMTYESTVFLWLFPGIAAELKVTEKKDAAPLTGAR